MKLGKLLIAALLVLVPVLAVAQQQRSGTLVATGTITVTNSFQSALAADNGRKGCAIQNIGSNTMYVFPGLSGPTTASSLQLTAGQIFYCGGPATLVITDLIQITGTANDRFVVLSQ